MNGLGTRVEGIGIEYHVGGSGEKLQHEQSGYKGRRRWDRLVKEYHEGDSGEKLKHEQSGYKGRRRWDRLVREAVERN